MLHQVASLAHVQIQLLLLKENLMFQLLEDLVRLFSLIRSLVLWMILQHILRSLQIAFPEDSQNFSFVFEFLLQPLVTLNCEAFVLLLLQVGNVVGFAYIEKKN